MERLYTQAALLDHFLQLALTELYRTRSEAVRG